MSIKKVQAENTEDFVVKAEANGFSYTLDYASRNPNKKSMGTSPTGLLLNSLAGCQLITARSFFMRQNINVNTLKVDITGDFNYKNDAWVLEADAILKIDVDLDEQQIDGLTKFIDRYCTVSGVLSAGNTINLTIENING